MSVACQISDNLRASRLEADELARLRRCGEALGITQLGVALVKAGGPGSDGEKMLGAWAAPSPQSWFQAASSGKHVTACLILDLASAGRLDLSDPIGSHLADLPGSWASRTIASLLHHTSGLPEYLSHLGASPPPADRAAFMQLAAQLSPIAQEGECWSYSNSNYILLGFLAEELCSRSTAEQIDAIFARAQVSGAKTATPGWVRAANAGLVDRAAADADSRMRQVIGDGDVAFTAEGARQWLHKLLAGTAIPGGTGAELFRPARVQGGACPMAAGGFSIIWATIRLRITRAISMGGRPWHTLIRSPVAGSSRWPIMPPATPARSVRSRSTRLRLLPPDRPRSGSCRWPIATRT